MSKVFSTLICSAALLMSAASYGQTWKSVGSATGISGGGASDISLYATGRANLDTLYVSYTDASASNGITVQMYAGGAWTTVGSAGFATTSRSSKLAVVGGVPYVAFSWGGSGHSYKANVESFNGSTWAPMAGGTDFSKGTINNVVFAYGGFGLNYYVGYSDSNTGIATIKQWDGSNYAPIGNASTGTATYNSMALYNAATPMVISIDQGNSILPTAKYYIPPPGAGWLDLALPASTTGAYTQIASNGSVTYAVYSDYSNGKQDVAYKFNGPPATASWVNVGSVSGFTTDEADYNSLAIENNTTQPVVAFCRKVGSTQGKANVMHYTGTNWASVGPADFSDGAATYTVLALNKGGDYFVAYSDANYGGKLVVKKFANPAAVPNVPNNTARLEVYPNPSTGAFTVKGDANTYSILNTIGQMVRTISLNAANNYSATVSNLEAGVYFIHGTNGVNEKVVVTK